MGRTIAIIPARGGSVRIPKKNIRLFHGKPIISYSIEAAIESQLFDAVYVSTDSAEIGDIAAQYGARVLSRPYCDGSQGTQELAGDILKKMPDVDAACAIYATAPMINPDDLAHGQYLLKVTSPDFVMSVGTRPLRDAAQFYWGHRYAFVAGLPLVNTNTTMLPIDESRVIDINTEDDWIMAEKMYLALKGEL